MTNEEVSLKEYFETLAKAHDAIHAQLEAAREIAVKDVNRRLDEMNQFRQQIQDERAEFLSKVEYDARHRELDTKVNINKDSLGQRISLLELAKSNMDGRFWMLGAGLTGVTVVLNIIFKFLIK